jgi:ketosteroid isomerase-like protein
MPTTARKVAMPSENENLIRTAYEDYIRGDLSQLLELVDPDLEWTYLDPADENPQPQTCHGRPELEWALRGQAERGLVSQLEEITAHGDKVMVVVRTPGIDQRRARQADDRNYLVLTLQQGRIIAMRACRDRMEARGFAGIG